jgi:hypothetical protein
MPRHALATFFERLVFATLPLCGCGGTKGGSTMMPPPGTTARDMSFAAAGDMAAGIDLGGPHDLAPLVPPRDLVGVPDPCDDLGGQEPVTRNAVFPKNEVPDGGFKAPCQSGLFCTNHCPSYYYTTCCGPSAGDGGSLILSCVPDCSGPNPGRRPSGLRGATIASRCDVGQWLAGAAHLEAASVHAFRRLARELAAHGAPAALVAQAEAAIVDERRHARLTARLARRHGALPPPARVTRSSKPRTLEAIATENAVEGCVRETFAALLATWQARAAGDESIRALMESIAPDEIRHAELSWRLDRWTRGKLDRSARRRVDAARERAVAELSAAVDDAPPSLVRAAGLPDRDRARALVAAVARELWSRAA